MSSTSATIKVFVDNAPFEVIPSHTVAQLKEQIHKNNTPIQNSSASLVFEDKPLEDQKTLEYYNILDGSHLKTSGETSGDTPANSETTQRPKKKARKRCSFKNCISAPLRGVGDCALCQGTFCSRHRLLEQHNCEGIQSCKQQMHERNAVRLQQQQTVASKV